MLVKDYGLVTIYIPTFNRLDLLKRSLHSVLDQTYKNIEVIVVDDCSTDNTYEFLKEISEKDNRVRYFIKEKNSGACSSRNIAIKNATGKFITGLDDDDFFEENRIQSFINAWKIKNTDTVALSSLYTVKNEGKLRYGKKILRKKIIKFNDMFLSNPVGNQIFTKTETLRKINGFDENLKCWQDLECWLRVLQLGNIEKIFNHTYIIDVSHDKPRIGNSVHEKYLVSQRYISKKFNLSKKYSQYLYLQTYNCKGVNLSLILCLKTFIRYPSIALFLKTLLMIFKV